MTSETSSTRSLPSLQTLSKTCNLCHINKPVTKFHKAGKGNYRGACKPCVNGGLRDSYDRTEVVRTVQYLDMPDNNRRKSYENVIRRMHRLGIMSDESAETALKRVQGG